MLHNVHRTKREVHFLSEDTTIERISDVIQQNFASRGYSSVRYKIVLGPLGIRARVLWFARASVLLLPNPAVPNGSQVPVGQ
ncbi:hypothetical protein C8R48DRAFT_738662 [Suillus tomentosus]|nr:hypothetical protein C8R48DRAFT_738662 [Suillus tomentosus]